MTRLLSGLHKLRDEAPDMPIAVLVTFFGIGEYAAERSEQDPISIRELAEKIGLPYSSTSRHIRYLGDMFSPDKRGLGWIDTDIVQQDRRQKTAFLTPKGKRVLSTFKATVGLE
ncbi:MarR family winged helix-turn-helix transcriptional regulator [Aestuariivirga sp. YIM B02566]|uniref:Winged helix-turn-helix transcriptional regulator n=1 Tax=Taklimakanibacter albus TaxID=2800327 RepID=A0ACC5RG60_9HYPH|nr:MarR family winged helix-turn-helix transcriptional regulator [Aestuariivirga sp. YIM B02566]MBK1871594.1 winged helix-turn-helix transcriptional regulator [Aestuariivirga sp. YIM B02566]